MRALVFDGNSARLDNAHPEPVATAGDAVIRVLKAAMSGIDLAICKGMLGYRGVIGHQFVGVVESVGGTAGGKLIGKRVVGSAATLCGTCDMCMGGLSSHCRSRTVMGMQGRAGCLAELCTLPVRNLVLVPDSIDNDHAVFAIDLASALQAASQVAIEGKPYITVVGDDSLALLTAQLMTRLNASVRLLSRRSETLTVGEKWGIKSRPVDEAGRRADQNIVVDCIGGAEGLALACNLVRPRGTILLKAPIATAHTVTDQSVDLAPVILNEIAVIGSFFGPVSEAVAMLARREADVVSLISKRMSLNDGPAIVSAASKPGAIKILVEASREASNQPDYNRRLESSRPKGS